MTPRQLLLALRDGQTAPAEAFREFALGLGAGSVSDAQAGAFAMAACLSPLSAAQRVALTLGMRDSGKVLDWDLPGKIIDKHSTGGVGDAVSLILAPMLAAVGCFVPMISGRGLGHTGGTLDKLEAIPGFKTTLSEQVFKDIVAKVGCAIVAPNPQIAPADRKLYATRDVTGTVRSLDLITSSILSKKLAAGLDALVLDVKTGSGAVMQSEDAARELARSLVETANGAGCPTTALITNMDQPLLPSIGNALEIADVMRAFDQVDAPIVQASVALGADLLVQAHAYYTEKGAQDALLGVLADGSAKAKFGEMIHAQGGPRNFAERWQDYLAIAPGTEVPAASAGYVAAIDGTRLGQLGVAIGGGRQKESDQIDHSVGLSQILRLGDRVAKGQPLAVLHCEHQDILQNAVAEVAACFEISRSPAPTPDLILDRITQ